MSWTTVIWSMIAGICLAMMCLFLAVWLRKRDAWENFFFSLSAAGAAAMALLELALMQAQTATESGESLRWLYVFLTPTAIGLVWFVRFYLKAGNLWLAWLICGMRALILVINFLPGRANAVFLEMHEPLRVPMWGTLVSLPQGVRSSWELLGGVHSLVYLVYLYGASRQAWRRGERKGVLILSGATSLAFILAIIEARMLAMGYLIMPYSMSMLFMIVVLAMGSEMGTTLISAGFLAQELRSEKERMRLAAKAANLGLWEYDIARDAILPTDVGRARVGAGDNEKISLERFLKAVHPDDREAVRKRVQHAVENLAEIAMEYRIIAPNGAVQWIAASGHVERNDKGKAVRLRGVTVDITERKESESERIQLRLELAHLNRVMTMSELSSSLAHEINQPLGSILNNASAAKILHSRSAEGGGGEVAEILDDIISDTNRAGQIVRKIRGIIKKESMAFEPLDINTLIREVVELFQNPLEREGISVREELSPDLLPVKGDRVRLQQVVMNLIMNATDAMKGRSPRTLTIHTAMQSPDNIIVSISDTGSGIDAQAREKMFEPFYTTKKDGLGMGLRICRAILEEHGGRIWAANNPDAGATFSFSLKVDTGGAG